MAINILGVRRRRQKKFKRYSISKYLCPRNNQLYDLIITQIFCWLLIYEHHLIRH